jgi:hypothetical protein
MAKTTDAPRSTPLPNAVLNAGFVAPVVGRKVLRDVPGYYGFPLIKAGEVITETIYNRAHQVARLYELIAATKEA